MRRLAILAAFVGLVGATDAESEIEQATPFDNPAYQAPEVTWKELPELTSQGFQFCADRIREARDTAGLPQLDRRTASPDKPELIYAVDHRRDGCGVLVMHGNTEDSRPVPEESEEAGIIPADSDQPPASGD